MVVADRKCDQNLTRNYLSSNLALSLILTVFLYQEFAGYPMFTFRRLKCFFAVIACLFVFARARTVEEFCALIDERLPCSVPEIFTEYSTGRSY